jgi:carbonic anhydrase
MSPDNNDNELINPANTVFWSYEGTCGPAYWGDLTPEFSPCREGRAQSPIDLTQAVVADNGLVNVRYCRTPINLVNTGNSIQLDVEPGSVVEINGAVFQLIQLHFHSPAEHTIDGQRCAIEMHLVHADSDGHIAVLAVMLTPGQTDHDSFTELWAHLPPKTDQRCVSESTSMNPRSLLPDDVTSCFLYTGSLTTPPCTEGVIWVVLTNPVALSESQIAAFRKLYDGNARPLQDRNARPIHRNAP